MIAPLRSLTRLTSVLAIVAAAFATVTSTPRAVAAQNPCLSCPNDQPPFAFISPIRGPRTSQTVDVVIGWCDDYNLREGTRRVTLNGQRVTPTPAFVRSQKPACGDYGESRLTITPAPGSNTLVATISDYTRTEGSPSVAWIYAPTPSVTPDGAARQVPPSAVQSEPFQVTNTGSARLTFTLSATCTGAETCTFAPTSVDLDPNEQRTVPVSYTSGNASSTGTVTLRAAFAADPSVFDVGSINVTSTAANSVVAHGVFPGSFETCGLDASNKAYCWGYNAGQLGIATGGNPMLSPMPVAGGLTFTMLSAAAWHTCGLIADGSAYCWGDNSGGALGDGSFINHGTPAAVIGGLHFSQIVNGFGFTCALAAGRAYCWGENQWGQRGDGTTTTVNVPTPVAGNLTFASLATGSTQREMCALTAAGDAYCWGWNAYGQIGTGTGGATSADIVTTPMLVNAGPVKFTQLGVGFAMACGLAVDGAAYCWGEDFFESGNYHMLGIGTTAPDRCGVTAAVWCAKTPAQVIGGRTFTALAVRGAGACGLAPDGAAYCWGYGRSGHNGDGLRRDYDTPMPVAGGLAFTSIAGGDGDTCALTASGQGYCWGVNDYGILGDGTQMHRAVPTPIIASGPTPAYAAVRVYPSNGFPTTGANKDTTVTWTVLSYGTIPTTYRLKATCENGVSQCRPAQDSVIVGAGARVSFLVNVHTGAGGSRGTMWMLAVSASDTLNQETRTQSFTIATDPTDTLPIATIGPGIERELCLTMSLAAGSAYECADLRMVHAVPGVTSLGKARAPVLLYSSQHAHPYPLVSAAVTLPAGQPLPSTVTATLLINGATSATGSWSGADWGAPSGTRKITLGYDAIGAATGVYPYTLQVVATTNGSVATIATSSGQIIIVNRAGSPFGAGWWVAGLDQLIPQTGNTLLFIGGDGSTRIYSPIAGSNPATWTAPQVDRIDAIQLVNGEYVQLLPHGLSVHFNAAGQHVSTVNRLGHTTRFTYDATCGQLASIVTPPANLSFTFGYTVFGTPTCTTRKLRSVTAPPNGFTARIVTIGAQANGQVLNIRDPDASMERFGYDPAFANRITSRTNEVGKVVNFGYGAGNKLAQASQVMDSPTPAIVTGYVPSETRGLSGSVAVDTAKDYTRVDGPRTDVADTSAFWLDRFGAPRKIANAIGQITTLTRGDARWPSLVTKMVAPTGLTSTAGYDARGHQVADTLFNPLGNGQNAISSYVWDQKWDAVISATNATGQRSTRSYDPTNGNILWSEFGGDTTKFAYTASGLPYTVTTSAGGRDVYSYDLTLSNLVTHTPPLQSTTTVTRDAIGQPILTRTPVNAADTLTVRTWYDVMGRDTLSWTYGRGDTLRVATLRDKLGRDTLVKQQAAPDLNALGWVQRGTVYDAAGRKLRETVNGTETIIFGYDAASNLTSGGRELFGATMSYDVLNRPTVRSSSSFNSRFTYDPVSGFMRTANKDKNAWTSRAYFPNGLVKADTQRIQIADQTTADSTTHVYALQYTYDIGGRRTSITYPSQLGGGQAQYTYDPRTGQLATVTDKFGVQFRYHYDTMGRLDTLVRRSNTSTPVTEVRTYDQASRLKTRSVVSSTGVLLESDRPVYDLRGKIVKNNGSAGGSAGDTTKYMATGAVRFSKLYAMSSYLSVDAMGNQQSHHNQIAHGFEDRRYEFNPATVQLRRDYDSQSFYPSGDTTTTDYDLLGNLRHSLRKAYSGVFYDNKGNMIVREIDWDVTNTYDDANKLVTHTMVYDTIAGRVGFIQRPPYVAQETYRYDALGRRTWYRSTKDTTCYYVEKSSGCHSTITRVIWDGSQILGEIRADGRTVSYADLENDNPSGLGPNYGVVGYTHDGVIDAPIGLFKGSDETATQVMPLANWRGLFDTGTCPAVPCTAATIVFPQSSAGLFWDGKRFSDGPPNWNGSLIEGQQDASGYLYRRNRYFDPGSGRFTQEDPIGLAGGLNVYGFGGGDPVNYSDPFGLWAWSDAIAQGVANWGARRRGVVGTVAVNVGAALNAGFEATGINAAAEAGDKIGNGDVVGGGREAAILIGGGKVAGAVAGRVTRALTAKAAGAVVGVTAEDIVESTIARGAKVKPHLTNTGEGVAIDFGDGTKIDIRVETHGGLHGNVQKWVNGKEVSNTHVRP